MGITPRGLSERPVVHHEDSEYLDAYRYLTRSRAHGEAGPLPISLCEMHAYLLIVKEQQVDVRLRFVKYIQDLDSVYLDHATKTLEARLAKNG